MRSYLLFSGAILVLFSTLHSTQATAQPLVDRLSLGYDMMYISRIHFKNGSSADVPGLYRNFLHLNAKKGPMQFGAVYQITRGEGFGAEADEGLMLTASYDHYFSYSIKAGVQGRLGISQGIDYANILYPTDTDIQITLGYFNPDGHGFLMDYPLFPSGYAGFIVNRFGRVQGIAGVGTFWRGLNFYLTGFYSINGVSNIGSPPEDQADIAFAILNNSGVSASLGYYMQDWVLGVRHNFPVFNSGNDWVFSIRRTIHFD